MLRSFFEKITGDGAVFLKQLQDKFIVRVQKEWSLEVGVDLIRPVKKSERLAG